MGTEPALKDRPDIPVPSLGDMGCFEKGGDCRANEG
jgi:hypothetical protein